MKTHPMSFSERLVRALLDRSKTQTRRVVDPQPTETEPGIWHWNGGKRLLEAHYGADYAHTDTHGVLRAMDKATPVRAGDRLWVKEKALVLHVSRCGTRAKLRYAADDAVLTVDWPNRLQGRPAVGKTLLARFMHFEASRIHLRATRDSWHQRIQAITEADAAAEGAPAEGVPTGRYSGEGDAEEQGSYRAGFRPLWDQTNGARGHGWEPNPWVRVHTFEIAEVWL